MLFVFVFGLIERKAQNTKAPQIARHIIRARMAGSEKSLKADKKNSNAATKKIMVFFFMGYTSFISNKKIIKQCRIKVNRKEAVKWQSLPQ